MGLLDFFAHIGRERWCIRRPCRALVATIIPWSTARAGTVGEPEWTGVGLHTLRARTVCTALGCCERYRSGGHVGARVSWDLPQALLTAFGHRPIWRRKN